MTPQQIDTMKLALGALNANYLLVNGTETHGGLEQCLDGYYSSCFDTDPINKQTEEAITALEEVLKEHAMREVQRLGQEIEQEPVAQVLRKALAWGKVYGAVLSGEQWDEMREEMVAQFSIRITTLPQRTWVGLTKQQQLDIFAQSVAKKRSEHEHYMAIEQALKEQNQ